MHEDSSSQFPATPNTESGFSPRAALWQRLGWLLVVGGIISIATGGWMYWQRWQEVNHPPARILEVSAAEAEQTLTPSRATSTTTAPTATRPAAGLDSAADRQATAVQTAEASATATPADPSPTVITATTSPSPTPAPATPTVAVTVESPVAAAIEAVIEATPQLAAEATVEATLAAAAPENATEDEVLSLADHPLLVPQDESGNPIDAAQTQPAAAQQTTTGSLARIVAESIGLDADVIDVGWQTIEQDGMLVNVWTVADYAAGWHTNSLLPGQNGNIVISGHHNVKGEVFRHIVDLEPDAVITLYDESGTRYDYVIEDKFILKDKGEPEAVRRANARWIGPFNEERLTLVTCWPYTNNSHRVIVIGKPLT